jgi:hypothetical protein
MRHSIAITAVWPLGSEITQDFAPTTMVEASTDALSRFRPYRLYKAEGKFWRNQPRMKAHWI